jgi:hypothetical protein
MTPEGTTLYFNAFGVHAELVTATTRRHQEAEPRGTGS